MTKAPRRSPLRSKSAKRVRRAPISLLWVGVLCAWTLFIWSNSLRVGVASEAQSTSVVGILEPIFRFFAVNDPGLMNFLVRKAAHFGEYLVLGLVDCLAFKPSLLEQGGIASEPTEPSAWHWIALLVLVVIPCIDESIQSQVPGRDAALSDVLIDIAGGTGGFLIALGFMNGMARTSRP